MERLTISMSDEFAEELSSYMRRHGYENRSEAVRDLARQALGRATLSDGVAGECVAVLSYVYDHRARELSKRLTEAHHARHDLQVATLHVHLDHETCLEAAVVKGGFAEVQGLADAIMAERGVNYAVLSPVPMKIGPVVHTHDEIRRGRGPHDHRKPRL